jgi:hypothetical protein
MPTDTSEKGLETLIVNSFVNEAISILTQGAIFGKRAQPRRSALTLSSPKRSIIRPMRSRLEFSL